MKSSKYLWTIILMISSIALLLVLQLLWLRSAYNNELSSFRKETNALFRGTIVSMHDSLIIKGLEPINGDSTKIRVSADSTKVEIWNAKVFKDTNRALGERQRIRLRDSASQIQIFVSSTTDNDSIRKVLRPIVSEFRRGRQQGNFVFRLGQDSLKIDDIQKNYCDTLLHSGILLVPSVKRINLKEWADSEPVAFHTEPFFLPHTPAYIAYFENIKPTMLAKISPQILFSIVLTILTISAFFIMYRNMRAQQKLVELKNDLISNITHELKTPVATVSVALEALKNFNALDNPQLTQEYLTIAQNELGRLSLMTDKILKTAVFEENGLSLKNEAVDLEKLIQHVLTSLQLVFEKHKAKVDFLKSEGNFIVSGNTEHLTNVIFNLLDNAIKYSLSGSGIKIHLDKDGSHIRLLIQDNGIGIPPEYQRKVFEKFFRVPTGDVHNAKGYGLGLSYVASVIKSLKGTIELQSEPGKGSIFTITLPWYQGDQ